MGMVSVCLGYVERNLVALLIEVWVWVGVSDWAARRVRL